MTGEAGLADTLEQVSGMVRQETATLKGVQLPARPFPAKGNTGKPGGGRKVPPPRRKTVRRKKAA